MTPYITPLARKFSELAGLKVEQQQAFSDTQVIKAKIAQLKANLLASHLPVAESQALADLKADYHKAKSKEVGFKLKIAKVKQEISDMKAGITP